MSSAVPLLDKKSAQPMSEGSSSQQSQLESKVELCASSHMANYCSRGWLAPSWMPRDAFHANATKSLALGSCDKVAAWGGKKLGKLKDVRVLDQDVRILTHAEGFIIFLPRDVWRKIDRKVPIAFPVSYSSCWIADSDFAFIKIDIDSMDSSRQEYLEDATALNKAEDFVKKNLLENMHVYPGRHGFTHGSLKVAGRESGGDFQYQF